MVLLTSLAWFTIVSGNWRSILSPLLRAADLLFGRDMKSSHAGMGIWDDYAAHALSVGNAGYIHRSRARAWRGLTFITSLEPEIVEYSACSGTAGIRITASPNTR